jgi:serine/threonine protein kinase
MPLEINSLLRDRYRITAELGRGGMGAVYKGYDENLGVEVAIKENLFTSPEAERQFKREATLLATLRHPNLPRVTDHFVVAEEGQYLVMDFIPGEDAKSILEKNAGPLPEDIVVRWAREILDALHYMHTRPQPIIHRDIKPGNIKITPEGKAVLVDFGLAKVHDVTSTTTVGAKALTPGFAPPEQYGMGRTEPRTDLYALGATLYTMLTNQLPADSLEQAMGQKKLIPVLDLNPNISRSVADAIERALALKPEDRFASAFEFAAALAQATRPSPAVAAQPATPQATVSTPTPQAETARRGETVPVTPTVPVARQRPGWVIPVIVIVALAVIGGGAWFATGGFTGLSVSPTDTPAPTNTSAPLVTPAPTDTTAPSPAPPTETSAPQATDTPAPPTETPLPTNTFTPAATPRGGGQGQIAFVSERGGTLPQIYVMNVDGSNPQRLTNQPEGACQPEWSPDGQKLLFISPCSRKADEYPRSAIYSMNADGTNVQPCITQIGGVYDPVWSSASGIAFTYLESTIPQIYVTQGCGSGSPISAPRSKDSQPTWSSSGDRLVFENTSRAGRPTLYWMFKDGKFEGSSPNQVTRDQDATQPAWQPGGNYIAYVAGTQIWVVLWDKVGFGATQLTNRGPNDTPNWSPDGQWLVFESWRDAANHDIYIMTAGGALQTRLTEDPAADYQPAWRP